MYHKHFKVVPKMKTYKTILLLSYNFIFRKVMLTQAFKDSGFGNSDKENIDIQSKRYLSVERRGYFIVTFSYLDLFLIGYGEQKQCFGNSLIWRTLWKIGPVFYCEIFRSSFFFKKMREYLGNMVRLITLNPADSQVPQLCTVCPVICTHSTILY